MVRVLIVMLGLTGVLIGCRVPPGEESPRLLGVVLYAQRCQLCHGPQGEGMGKVGTAIGNPEFLATASDEFLYNAIALGRPGTTMSPWAENGMTPEQITSLVKHMRKWQRTPSIVLDNKIASGDKIRGEALYTQHCASCHGPNGDPGRDPVLVGTHLSNPVFLAQASDAFLTYAIANGRTGTTMAAYSQAKGGALSDKDIEDIVTLIRSWQR